MTAPLPPIPAGELGDQLPSVMTGYQPLATVEDMREGPYKFVLTGAGETYAARTMVRASRSVESRCGRRLAPFVGASQSLIADGVAGDDMAFGGLPISMAATLGVSRAQALGNTGGMVRDFWIDDHPPLYTELWTYSDVSARIYPSIGGAGQDIAAGGVNTGVVGPMKDTGHIRLPYGSFCPAGSVVEVTYSGGYTLGIPEDLTQAAMMAAARLFLLEISPEGRGQMTTAELEAAIVDLLAPWAKA